MIPSEVLNVWLPLLEHDEGCVLTAYLDPVGIWTIGYGHTGPDVPAGLVWTQQQADDARLVDMQTAYAQLLQSVPATDTWSPGRQAAISDFVYNLGIGKFRNSTLHSAVLVGAWESAKHQMSLWVHGGGKILPGLVARRAQEIALVDAS